MPEGDETNAAAPSPPVAGGTHSNRLARRAVIGFLMLALPMLALEMIGAATADGAPAAIFGISVTAILVVAAALHAAVERGIARPIRLLIGAVDRLRAEPSDDAAASIASGSLHRRRDEIGQMSRCIAALAQEIVTTRRMLDERVAERTTELMLLNRKLELLATTDHLTGIANRRAFIAAHEERFAAARDVGEPLALALIDIDHFKSVNDRLGHPAGDHVLQMFALTARSVCPAGRTFGRLGGEEFAMLMPNAGFEQAAEICERLRAAVQGTPIVLPSGGRVRLTVSIGMTAMRPEDSPEAMLSRADAALYGAKQAGRNCVRGVD
jgi:diguanylate cyclase (GGDEF)-like protein